MHRREFVTCVDQLLVSGSMGTGGCPEVKLSCPDEYAKC